jgi:DHA2 family multidrug resistance protein-like MFS transporter
MEMRPLRDCCASLRGREREAMESVTRGPVHPEAEIKNQSHPNELSTNNQRWFVLLTVGASLLLITLDNAVLYTALPTLIRELGASSSQSLWIINAYPLVMTGLLLSTGTLGDRIGHRQMFLGGLALFGLASLAAAFAPTPGALIGARAILAIGAATMMPATLALIRITFEDERERNLAIALWSCLSIVGNALGPIIGGLLLEHFWWGSVFLINVPVVIAAFISGLLVTPRTLPDLSRLWDKVSSVQVMVFLSALVAAIQEFSHSPPSVPTVAVALGVALIAGTLFVRRQARLPQPMLDFAILRNSAFMAGVLGAAFAIFTLAGVQLITTQRFQLISGFSPLEAGCLVSIVALGCLPSAVVCGGILHRTGLLPLIGGGLFVAALGVLLASAGLQHLGWMIAGLSLTGLGLGTVMAVASSAIIGNVDPRKLGMASSVEGVSFEFGSLLAVAVLGSLLAALFSSGIQLPQGASAAAREGMTEALVIASRGGAVGPALIEAASRAFDQSYLILMHLIAGVLLFGAAVTSFLLRRHGPGSVTYNLDSQ